MQPVRRHWEPADTAPPSLCLLAGCKHRGVARLHFAAEVLLFIWGPIPAFHRLAGIVVFLALALFGTELLRRQTAAEFPDAGHASVSAATGGGTPA